MDNFQTLSNPDSTALFVENLRESAKKRADWQVGVEIELFGFDAKTKQRLDNAQVQAVLRGLADSKHDLVFENGLLIETRLGDGGKFTVEPGGQIEFSSAARFGLCEIENDLQIVFGRLAEIGRKLQISFLALGFDPLRRIEEQNWFLGAGYKLMKPYLATRGIRAWDMMTRTCSVQVNLDYGDEPDLIKKFILGNRLAPVVAAIFANSPFADGAVSGFKSMRVAAWSETDDDRCGVSPLALQNEFSLADFVEYALDVPILLLRRNNLYIERFAGKSFRKLLADGEIEPNITNFQNHLNKIFTEARLKNYLEFRAADCGNLEQALAISALWKGLLYDEKSLQSAIAIAPKLDAGEFRALQLCVAKNGLAASCGKTKVLDLAKKIVELAHEGLKKNAPDEARFLDVLRKRVLIEEVSPADVLLENCQNSVEEVFEFAAI